MGERGEVSWGDDMADSGQVNVGVLNLGVGKECSVPGICGMSSAALRAASIYCSLWPRLGLRPPIPQSSYLLSQSYLLWDEPAVLRSSPLASHLS